MEIKSFKQPVTKMMHDVGFVLNQKSPEILVASGVASIVAAIFFSVKNTMKLEDILKIINQDLKFVKDKMTDNNKIASGEYDLRELKKELIAIYAKSVYKIGKLYLPTAIFLATSITSLFGVHNILKGRNIALAAAYTAVDAAYSNYRKRVVSRVGEEVEKEIYRNVFEEKKNLVSVNEDGTEKISVKTIKGPHVDKDSIYTYLFDASNPDWSNSGRLNLDYLLAKEKFLNQKLIAQGYLFLSDVHSALGIEPGMIGEKAIQAGRVIGWIYDTSETGTGDNYISFGLADKEGNLNKDTMDMLRHGERDVYLEFNPDGDILTGQNEKKTFMKYARMI